MRLTPAQKKLLLTATKESDWCCIGHARTMNALVRKKLAKFTSGFGYQFSAIIEVNEEGRKIINQILTVKK